MCVCVRVRVCVVCMRCDWAGRKAMPSDRPVIPTTPPGPWSPVQVVYRELQGFIGQMGRASPPICTFAALLVYSATTDKCAGGCNRRQHTHHTRHTHATHASCTTDTRCTTARPLRSPVHLNISRHTTHTPTTTADLRRRP